MTERASGLVTLLFTDLVGSTELLSRAGDEQALRIFRAHHDLLSEAAAMHGGQEVKWLGDGLMVAFSSAADAVRCAISMQQCSRQPVHGEELAIRVGLNAGEALRETADYFGLPVVVARRLCDQAGGGQILCTETVAGLLAGRGEFAFTDRGKLALKGVPEPVAACEVRYQVVSTPELPARPPMVGRDAEFARLAQRLSETMAGRGGLATVTGEPGIGKTRMLDELTECARRQGVTVLSGRCFESEWSPPYGPFAEALAAFVITVDGLELRADVGPGAPALARIVPKVRELLPDVPEPVPVQPDEERFRALDAMAQFLVARSRRAPVLVCLDDLHWAEKGTVAMLRHLARLAPAHRVLVVGAYRETDVDPAHPLIDTLQALRRETGLDHVSLEPLGSDGVHALLESIGRHEFPARVGDVWTQEVGGNPFFIEEMVRHLIETGDAFRDERGHWTTSRPLRDLTVPEGIQDVVARRLSRLSEPARKLLAVAAAFEGHFRFDVAAGVAGLPEPDALDGLDQAVQAQVVRPAGSDDYVFAHALIRHSIYGQLTPSRRMRLHRRVAEALESVYGEHPPPLRAAEIASQYHRSAELPGAERGVEPALVAAGHAQATGAHDEAAVFLRMALDMLGDDDRRPRLLGRLAIVLAWALRFDEAVRTAAEAGRLLAEGEGKRAAAEYLSDAAYVCALAGGVIPAWEVTRTGLDYAEARDVAWARLVSFDYERRAAEDPDHRGIPADGAERREAARILREAHLDPMGPAPMEGVVESRAEALTSSNLVVLLEWAGEYAGCLRRFEAEAEEAECLGRVARAARAWSGAAMCRAALGRLQQARADLARAQALGARLGTPIFFVLTAQDTLALPLDDGWPEVAATMGPLASSQNPALAWGLGLLAAYAARATARLGQDTEALGFLGLVAPWLELAPAWTIGIPLMASHAAETLWVLERLNHAAVIERAVREKVIAPDFRFPMVDGRLALARLCALQGRHEEAARCFADSRQVLRDQGAAPLLAIANHDEALMYLRRGEPGDTERASPLIDSARHQFEELGLTSWVRQTDELGRRRPPTPEG